MGRASDTIMGIMRLHSPCLLGMGNLVEKRQPASLIRRCEFSSIVAYVVACCVCASVVGTISCRS
jgi:hypothetical protein